MSHAIAVAVAKAAEAEKLAAIVPDDGDWLVFLRAIELSVSFFYYHNGMIAYLMLPGMRTLKTACGTRPISRLSSLTRPASAHL